MQLLLLSLQTLGAERRRARGRIMTQWPLILTHVVRVTGYFGGANQVFGALHTLSRQNTWT
jgi:hypothetical protein